MCRTGKWLEPSFIHSVDPLIGIFQHTERSEHSPSTFAWSMSQPALYESVPADAKKYKTSAKCLIRFIPFSIEWRVTDSLRPARLDREMCQFTQPLYMGFSYEGFLRYCVLRFPLGIMFIGSNDKRCWDVFGLGI